MLTKLFRQTDIPVGYRSNFLHFYLDIAWFGVLSGSAVNFLNIYAARVGASGFQIGLIGAMSAIVSLFLAIPAGHWLQKQHTGKAIFWTSVLYRLGFLPFVFLPWLFDAQGQIWAIIIITFLMAIPLTPLGVGFNVLFAESVPSEYRAHVAGIRNIMLSITFMVTSLISGYLLNNIAFPVGYQIVFAIGAVGAAMSSLHLYFVRPLERSDKDGRTVQPPLMRDSVQDALPPPRLHSALRLDIWKTAFKRVLLCLLGFHLTQYIAIPIFPLYFVNELHLNDNHIGIGTALFYLTVLISSTRLRNFVHRLGNKIVTSWGVIGLAFYPFLLSMSSAVWHFYGISLLGGFVFALINGAYANYMLEHIPANDRPSHLAWYNVILNAAVLFGSLGGPIIADQLGLSTSLILFAILRLLAGLAILKWG
ncbi:MAG TPA: MFS transporter, partial [Anaerolineales bacterium]|nr:MFS transporter [Anaerolineales bacterium]